MADLDRSEPLEIELTDDELARLLRIAESEGVALEDWVRDVVLEALEPGWENEPPE